MAKKIIALLIIVSLSIISASCAQPAPTTPAEVSVRDDELGEFVELAQYETGNNAGITNSDILAPQLLTYTYFLEHRDGYEIIIELTIGEWIRVTDTDLASAAWSSVGGVGEVPCHRRSNNWGAQDDTFLVFGNIRFTNITSGFDLSVSNPLNMDPLLWRSHPDDGDLSGSFGFVGRRGIWVYLVLQADNNLRSYGLGRYVTHAGLAIFNIHTSELSVPTVRLTSNISEYPFLLAMSACAPTPNKPMPLEEIIEEISWTIGIGRYGNITASDGRFYIRKSWNEQPEDGTIEYRDSGEYGVEWARVKAERITADLEAIGWAFEELSEREIGEGDGAIKYYSISARFLEYRVDVAVSCIGVITKVYYSLEPFQLLKSMEGIGDIQLLSPAQLSAMR